MSNAISTLQQFTTEQLGSLLAFFIFMPLLMIFTILPLLMILPMIQLFRVIGEALTTSTK